MFLRGLLASLSIFAAACLHRVLADDMDDKRCLPGTALKDQIALLAGYDDVGLQFRETHLLINRCMDEQPLINLFFGSQTLANPNSGLLGPHLLRWWEAMEGSRHAGADGGPDGLVNVLELLRLVAGALHGFAEGVLALAVQMAMAQVCAKPVLPSSCKEKVLQLSAVCSREVADVVRQLPLPDVVARPPEVAPDGLQWIASLGIPGAIAQLHAAIDVQPVVAKLHRYRDYPGKVFLFLFDLARTVAFAGCRFQSHLLAYIQVAAVEAAEHCLVSQGRMRPQVLADPDVEVFLRGWSEAVLELHVCSWGPMNATRPVSLGKAGVLKAPYSIPAAVAAIPKPPEYRFSHYCCRRYHVLEELLSTLGAGQTSVALVRMVEIGVRHGDTSVRLLSKFDNLELVAVDPYEGNDDLFAWVAQRLSTFGNHRARVIRKRSSDVEFGVEVAGPFDLIFVDGSHRTLDVVRDITRWEPLVRPGGVLAGHDMFNPLGDVHAAVRYLHRKRGSELPIYVAADYTFYWHPSRKQHSTAPQ